MNMKLVNDSSRQHMIRDVLNQEFTGVGMVVLVRVVVHVLLNRMDKSAAEVVPVVAGILFLRMIKVPRC